MLTRPLIVAPDSSHWANWIDAALSGDGERRSAGRSFHQRLLNNGRIPFLSWHHLEEMLYIDSAENAAARVSYIQTLPFIAWMQLPKSVGLGAITDIVAAEAIAFDAGCHDMVAVRDHVRTFLMRTGPAIDAIGRENWVWETARPLMIGRRPQLGMIAAFSGLVTLDERQTVGQLASQPVRSPIDRDRMRVQIYKQALSEAQAADPRRTLQEAQAMADQFMIKSMQMMPNKEVSIRDLIVDIYVKQGIDPHEITDDSTVGDLSTLAIFRSQLRIAAKNASLSFDRLKRVRMESLPSWCITDAIDRYGQKRTKRPASDAHDKALAVLAAYTDITYVDKRTYEDLRRVIAKAPQIAKLFGSIEKASCFEDIEC